jgi:hypothetical protein
MWGSRNISADILNLCTRWGWAVSLPPQEGLPVPFEYAAGRLTGWVCTFEEKNLLLLPGIELRIVHIVALVTVPAELSLLPPVSVWSLQLVQLFTMLTVLVSRSFTVLNPKYLSLFRLFSYWSLYQVVRVVLATIRLLLKHFNSVIPSTSRSFKQSLELRPRDLLCCNLSLWAGVLYLSDI